MNTDSQEISAHRFDTEGRFVIRGTDGLPSCITLYRAAVTVDKVLTKEEGDDLARRIRSLFAKHGRRNRPSAGARKTLYFSANGTQQTCYKAQCFFEGLEFTINQDAKD
jgi:hypothetical protein